ncbi:MAG TPA: hypothetical protein VMX57_07490 [Planctomycetota bacterium]|nr:hypothetical protein [Planctomycetota bacterium]
MKCDRCDNAATVHITEIRRGLSYERHLCEDCAETLLPTEESDYAEYLEVLPPRWSAAAGDESEPTEQELGMTGLRERVVVLELDTARLVEVGLHQGSTSVPVWSPDSERLAMCHYVETLHSLVLVEPARPWQRRFLRTSFAEPASWSHDGTSVVFSHPEESGTCIISADVSQGTLRRIHPLPYLSESTPACSPVDDRIVFVGLSMEGENPDTSWCCISTARADGESRRRLVTLPASFVLRPEWSADARFVAALASPLSRYEIEQPLGGAVHQALHVLRADARDARDTQVTGNYMSFAWVPHAAGFRDRPVVLAARLAPHQFTSAAVLIDPESGEMKTLIKGIVFPARQVRTGHLSPDGRTLLVLSGGDNRRIRCIDVETTSTSEIDVGGEVVDFAWLPEGKTFAVLVRAERDTRVEMMTPGGDRREVASFPRETFFDVPAMVLSPDGRRAALEVHVPRKD